MNMEKNVLERALLCTLFLNNVAILEVMPLLRPEMFSDLEYGFIYQSFVALYNRGKEPDMVLVGLEMSKTDPERCRRMGGISYLADGMEEVRLEHNAVEYAREIRQRYQKNCLHKLFVCMASECMREDMDYQKVLETCEHKLLKFREEDQVSDSLKPLSELADQVIEYQVERMNHKDDPVRMLTGIHGIDGLTGGLYRKELMVLGGQTSDGKTSLAMFMAMNIARKGKSVLYYSFEMTDEQTMSRIFTGYAGVESERLRIGGLRDSDLSKMRKYRDQLQDLPYYFVNASSKSLEALRAEIMLRKLKGECDAVVVDYLHSFAPPQGKGETLESVTRNTITGLKSIAVEANCAMLVLSQLNRELGKRDDKEGYVPRMTDLRDSGAIEYIADSVAIISRPDRYGFKVDDNGNDISHQVKIYLLKNRNGATGLTEVYRNDTFTNFTNPSRELHFED